MQFTVNAQILKSAMVCTAKKDLRYYIKGVYITTDADIVATNGHTLYHAQDRDRRDTAPTENLLVVIDGTIPNNADIATFDTGTHVVDIYKADNLIKSFRFDTIDEKFPDFNTVIPTDFNSTESCNVLGITAEYLSLVSKVFRGSLRPVKLEFKDDESPYLLTPDKSEVSLERLVIMPYRLK